MTRPIVSAVVLGLLVSPVFAVGAAGGDAARLVVKNRHVDNGVMYMEGAFQFLVLKRADGTRVLKRRYPYGGVRLDRALPAGRYRLFSYTRSCAGVCPSPGPKCESETCPEQGSLDPPSDGCKTKTFGLSRGAHLTFRLVTATDERCRFRRTA